MLKSDGLISPSSYDMIYEIGVCETNYDVFRILRIICTETRCKTFMASELPKDENFKLQEMLIVSNWDPELIREFDLNFQEKFETLYQSIRESINPVHIELPVNLGENVETHNSMTPNGNLLDCVFFPVYDRTGRKGVVGFSAAKSADEHRFAKLGFLSSFVFDKLMEIKRATITRNKTLSEREIQCLNWTALGKTSYEIGIILDISLNTVNHYLHNASKKLNCVNRTHAVAKCVQEGIIEF